MTDSERLFTWTTGKADRALLQDGGFTVLSFPEIQRTLIRTARAVGPHRRDLQNSAAELLRLFDDADAVAIVDVALPDARALFDLYSYLVVPARERQCRLLVHADRELEDLTPGEFYEPEAGYAWTLQRLRLHHDGGGGGQDGRHPWPRGTLAGRLTQLDRHQAGAVSAGMGVTQVIAPAGSGKTRTLIARVEELIARGVPEQRILCTTFNKKTRDELRQRLAAAGVVGTSVHHFHALGRHILDKEGMLRGDIGELSYRIWRALCTQAKKETGTWVEPQDAKAAIEDLKLKRISPGDIDPAQYPNVETLSLIYRIYQQELAARKMDDFSDLILRSLALLESSGEARERWQSRWECILVDEYQDIEPIQEHLVRMLAAPHDCLYIVGDEDQCIYSWRRATPTRMVQLDQLYPALERHVLQVSYRCPKTVVELSDRLIRNNRARFPKPIESSPDRPDMGLVETAKYPDYGAMAASVVQLLKPKQAFSDYAVLARTRRLVKIIAVALHDAGVPFRTRPGVLEPSPAEKTVLAYSRLLAHPEAALDDDVARVFDIPPTGLPAEADGLVASRLRGGATFLQAVADLRLPDWGIRKVEDRAALLESLQKDGSPGSVLRRLLKEGGLEAYFKGAEQMNPVNMDAVETLLQLAAEAAKCESLSEFATQLADRLAFFESGGNDEGFEIDTIHGSKGREWDHVVLFACDDDQLPHSRTLEDTPGRAREDAMEEERRLAYVAFTRVKKSLLVQCLAGTPSRFLYEAGVLEPPRPRPLPPRPAPRPTTGGPTTPPKPKPVRKGGGRVKTANVGKVENNKTPDRKCAICRAEIPVGGLMARVRGRQSDDWAHVKCAGQRR